jgi:glycosyltransferase involved in cell wall biosynthesis
LKNDNSDITVCIFSYNRPKYLIEAIESVLNQTFTPKYIRIYDNGSDKIVRESVIKYLDLGVKWIPTLSPSKTLTNNFINAIKDATTEYIVMLHDDDRFCNEFLESQLNFLEQNKNIAAISCNGHSINERGLRTGFPVLKKYNKSKIYLFKNSGSIAKVYAQDECIPFSPTIFRTKFLRKVNLRDIEFGKVCDAVLFCDLADISAIALNGNPLYECRLHDNQDSTYFDPLIIQKLEDFFWTRRSSNIKDTEILKKLLVAQHTRNTIREIYNIIKSSFKLLNFLKIMGKLTHKRFRFYYVVIEVIRLTIKILKN